MAALESIKADLLGIAVIQSRWDQPIETNTSRAVDWINEAARGGARVVVFPEAYLTTYDFPYAKTIEDDRVQDAVNTVRQACRDNGVYAITGTLQRRSGDEKLLNMAHIIGPDGRVIHEYAKLFLGGKEENDSCRRGDKVSMFEIDGIASSVIICRDGRHPELTAMATMAGAQIIFQISNNCDTIEKSWWKDTAGRSSHPLSPRTANFHVCANAVGFNRGGDQLTLGHSFILDPSGLPLVEGGRYDECLLITRLTIQRATRRFAIQSLTHPEMLVEDWAAIVAKIQKHKDDEVR